MLPSEREALRAEHDELARRVATRQSIDDVRLGAYTGFGTFVAAGLTLKFAWDRWGWGPPPARPPGRYPLLFLGALVLFAVLGAVTATTLRRARRTMTREDADFARLQEIRRTLEMEP